MFAIDTARSCVVSRMLVQVTMCMKQVEMLQKESLELHPRTCCTMSSPDMVHVPHDSEYKIMVGSLATMYCELCFTIFKVKPRKSGRGCLKTSLVSPERSVKPRTVIALQDFKPWAATLCPGLFLWIINELKAPKLRFLK